MRKDELLDALARLRSTEPDQQWAERVRRSCHARLAQTRRSPAQVRFRMGWLETASLAALWFYVAIILQQIAQVLGMRDRAG